MLLAAHTHHMHDARLHKHFYLPKPMRGMDAPVCSLTDILDRFETSTKVDEPLVKAAAKPRKMASFAVQTSQNAYQRQQLVSAVGEKCPQICCTCVIVRHSGASLWLPACTQISHRMTGVCWTSRTVWTVKLAGLQHCVPCNSLSIRVTCT